MKMPLLFCLFLIAFWGCRKAEKQNAVNEINIGFLGVKILPNKDSIHEPTFKEFYSLDLNTNKLLVIENPVLYAPLQKQKIKEYLFNFSTNRIIGSFIDFAKETESITLLDFSRNKDTDTECPTGKWRPTIIYIEFIRDKNSKYYIVENQYAAPVIKQLYYLLIEISKTHTPIAKNDSLKINADSLYSIKAKNFKIKFETPPPPVQPTIKFTPPAKKK